MFDLKRPCSNCPFTKGNAGLFMLGPDRLEEIRTAMAFQCHKTFGKAPQQCAGLMAVLNAEETPNAIMRVAQMMLKKDFDDLETKDTFSKWADVLKAHKAPE